MAALGALTTFTTLTAIGTSAMNGNFTTIKTWADALSAADVAAGTFKVGVFTFPGVSAAAVTIGSQVSADTLPRFALCADGKMYWSKGSDTYDLNLYRSAAGVLKTDYALQVVGALTTNGGLQTFGANDSGGTGYRMVRVPNA